MKPEIAGEISIIDTTFESELNNTAKVIKCEWWEKFLAFFGIGKC
jgi:hypothetical protein